jgi:glycosyltransferase involved in cell wall biosynthesis
VVVTFHDLRVPYLFPKAGPVRTWIVRWLARTADGVIATDPADESTLRHRWNVQRVRQIPIGCNRVAALAAGYDRDARRAALGIHSDGLLISYFGFMNQSKGVLVLLAALKQLVDQQIPIHLVMIGGRVGASDPSNAGYAAQVDAFISRHGLEDYVHWTGFVEDAELSACFNDIDLVVLPYLDGASLRRSALMTAFAHGRPVVTTTPQTAIPELARAMETVPPGDSEALAGMLISLWRNPSRRRELEQAVQQAAQTFGRERIARETAEYFSELRARHT